MKKAITEILRHHISALIAITGVNIFLYLIGEPVAICFSLLFPQDLVFEGLALSAALEIPSLAVCGIVLCSICVLLFVVCLIASYRSAGWLFVSTSLLAADTAYAIYLAITYNDSSYYIDIATHIWCIIALTLAAILAELSRKKKKAATAPEPAPEQAPCPIPCPAEPAPVKKHTNAVISPEFLKPAERKYSRRR